MKQLLHQFDSILKNNRISLLVTIAVAVIVVIIRGNELASLRTQIDQIRADTLNINLDIKELGVRIGYPLGCNAQKSDDRNRAGSYVSYDFNCLLGDGSLTLQEILLYTKSSIQKFERDCQNDTPCFFGYTPSSNDYSTQKDALSANNQKFLTRYISGPNGGFRVYVTYIGDTRIEAWIFLSDTQPNDTLNTLSDDEFSKFQFSPLQ